MVSQRFVDRKLGVRWYHRAFSYLLVRRPFGSRVLRGRVSRVSLIRGGELSVVVRFGIDEFEEAKKLAPGALVSLSIGVEFDKPPEKKQ